MKNSVLLIAITSVTLSCAEIEPSTTAETPTTHAYSELKDSGLSAGDPYPTPADVCVRVKSTSATSEFEKDGHILIACPKHEMGALEVRQADGAVVVGNVKHWTVLRIAE